MKKILCLTAALLALACVQKPKDIQVLPLPSQITRTDGSFCVKGAAVQVDENLDEASRQAVARFVAALETATGVKTKEGAGGFHFSLNENLGVEQYAIKVSREGVEVEASALNGFVYALETIKQLLPAGIYGGKKAKGPWKLPCVSILDQPRFSYRGVMLDPCRHFWSVEETKKIIDVMAAYKLNRLHWHLTDDQGWRIEIKAYPKLTEVGAWRAGTQVGKDQSVTDGIPYGGFYTQEELRDVVAYAAARGITIIPEIDLPGHMLAALAAYPELGCKGGPYEVRQIWGISQDILCAGNEEIYTFIDKVFDEVADIFPSEYVHVGGDECFGNRHERKGLVPWDKCPKCQALMKKLHITPGMQARHYVQDYVTLRVQQILAARGRRIIGWDEILQGELAPGATVMSWRGTAGGEKAVAKGMDVVMSPNTYLYIDYYQSREQEKEPLAIGKYLPVEKVYGYEPMDGMPEGAEDHVLGVQCNLWTEYVTTPEHLEYMLLPRMIAAAEIGWVAADAKDYARFDASLDHSFAILDAMGLTYCLDCRGLIGLDRIPSRDTLTLMTYNVGAFSKYLEDSTPGVAALIREVEAEVVALNELDSCNLRHGVNQAEVLCKALGGEWDYLFGRAIPYKEGAYGNGVVCHDPIIRRHTVPLPKGNGAEDRSVTVAETQRYVLGAVHLDYKDPDSALAQMKLVNEWFGHSYAGSPKPVFLCGDFNVLPDSPVIAEARKCWKPLSGEDPTFPSRNPVKCIDYLFALRAAAPVEVLSCQVLSDDRTGELSDHAPVLVSIKY